MKNQPQTGFAIVETLLVVVILSLIGGTGYYVWHSKQAADTSLKVADSTAQAAGGASHTASSTNYMVISEWGVKVPLSAADAGAYYEVSKFNQPTPPINLTVYAKESDTITGPAGKNCKGEYIAYLMRLPSSDPHWSSTSEDDDFSLSLFTERKQIGAYTYGIATKKQYGPDCFQAMSNEANYQSDAATAQKFDVVVQAFLNDFKGVKAN